MSLCMRRLDSAYLALFVILFPLVGELTVAQPPPDMPPWQILAVKRRANVLASQLTLLPNSRAIVVDAPGEQVGWVFNGGTEPTSAAPLEGLRVTSFVSDVGGSKVVFYTTGNPDAPFPVHETAGCVSVFVGFRQRVPGTGTEKEAVGLYSKFSLRDGRGAPTGELIGFHVHKPNVVQLYYGGAWKELVDVSLHGPEDHVEPLLSEYIPPEYRRLKVTREQVQKIEEVVGKAEEPIRNLARRRQLAAKNSKGNANLAGIERKLQKEMNDRDRWIERVLTDVQRQQLGKLREKPSEPSDADLEVR